MSVNHLGHLCFRTVMRTEETRALRDGLLIYLSTCRDDTGRVILYLQRHLSIEQFSYLHLMQLPVVVSCLCPCLHLSVEETRQTIGMFFVCTNEMHLLTSDDLHGTQTILIQVIGIDTFYRQGCIAIASPTATEV